MNKNFRELLLQNHLKPLGEQRDILHQTLNEWMGDEEQTDDVIVMGFRPL